jgi:hypothetical protein
MAEEGQKPLWTNALHSNCLPVQGHIAAVGRRCSNTDLRSTFWLSWSVTDLPLPTGSPKGG